MKGERNKTLTIKTALHATAESTEMGCQTRLCMTHCLIEQSIYGTFPIARHRAGPVKKSSITIIISRVFQKEGSKVNREGEEIFANAGIKQCISTKGKKIESSPDPRLRSRNQPRKQLLSGRLGDSVSGAGKSLSRGRGLEPHMGCRDY